MIKPLLLLDKMKKRGLSVVIGYVLLVTFGIILSVIVYGYLKTYVPKDIDSCPSGVSLSVLNYDYNCTSNVLNVTIKNNGLFNVNGYYIYATTNPNATIATVDLSSNFSESLSETGMNMSGVVYFDVNPNTDFGPSSTKTHVFSLNGRVYRVEIVPARFQDVESTTKFIGCGDSSVEELLTCS